VPFYGAFFLFLFLGYFVIRLFVISLVGFGFCLVFFVFFDHEFLFFFSSIMSLEVIYYKMSFIVGSILVLSLCQPAFGIG